MKITVVGTGYSGLVLGTCLAENGHNVTCVDRKADRIAGLSQGEIHFHEPGLEELIARNIEEERLEFTTDLAKAVDGCLITFLCVGTPADIHGHVDLSDIENAVKDIGKALTGYSIVVNKSTCPPGTGDHLEAILREASTHTCDLVVNPDFLKEGNAVDDFMRPDRVVVGCDDVRVREIMKELYSPFLRTGKPFLAMDRRSAEMVKYATIVMLASRISTMNQLADICAACDADVSQVREGVAADDRIGSAFMFPGLGYGGFSLPKDIATCIRIAEDGGADPSLIEAIAATNESRQEGFIKTVLDHYGSDIAHKKIAIWGVSFKPRTDSLRGAPALKIIHALCEAGAEVVAYDPVAGEKLKAKLGDSVSIAPKYYQALEGADGLVIATEWNEFRRPDYQRMASLMREPIIFDGRNLYTPSVMAENGFTYISIGRPAVSG